MTTARRKGQLNRLLSKDWLELAIIAHLQEPEEGFDESNEPNYVRVSSACGDSVIAYRKLLGVHIDTGPPVGPDLRRKFHDGLDVQRRYIDYFRKMGILEEPKGWNEEQGILATNDIYGLKGHIDCRIRTPEGLIVPVEIKAMNDRRINGHQREPEVGPVQQLMMYEFLDDAPFGFLIAEGKDNQVMSIRRMPIDFDIVRPVLRNLQRIWQWVRLDVDPWDLEALEAIK